MKRYSIAFRVRNIGHVTQSSYLLLSFAAEPGATGSHQEHEKRLCLS